MPAHFSAPGTFVKKETTSSASATAGMAMPPLTPWTMKPMISTNGIGPSPSINDASMTPPPVT